MSILIYSSLTNLTLLINVSEFRIKKNKERYVFTSRHINLVLFGIIAHKKFKSLRKCPDRSRKNNYRSSEKLN